MTIHTRWHKLTDAVARGGATLAVSPEVSHPVAELPPGLFRPGPLGSFLDDVGRCPRFVIPPQLAAMTVTKPALQSLSDMHVCDVVRLPYPECVIEFDIGDGDRFHVHLAEADGLGNGMRWVGTPLFSYRDKDRGREVATVFPVSLAFGLVSEPGSDPDNPDVRFHHAGTTAPWVAHSPEAVGYAEAVAALAFRRIAVGFMAAILLHATTGLRREAVRVPSALNKARGRGRSPIPDHTVVRLWSYEAEPGRERGFDERAPAEVHLRRTHKRRVACGPGRTERRWRIFPAQVIGYLPDGRKPEVAELLASRAARPYVVRTAPVRRDRVGSQAPDPGGGMAETAPVPGAR